MRVQLYTHCKPTGEEDFSFLRSGNTAWRFLLLWSLRVAVNVQFKSIGEVDSSRVAREWKCMFSSCLLVRQISVR